MHQNVGKVCALLAIFILFTFIYAFHFFCRYKPLKEGVMIYNQYLWDNKSYLIQTPGCSIPKFDPFDATVKKFYVRTPYSFTCMSKKSIFSIRENGTVSLVEDVLWKEYNLRRNQIDCYFYPISRKDTAKKPDDHFVLGKRHDLIFDLPIEDDFILIKCYRGNISFMKDILALTPIKPSVEETCTKRERTSKLKHEKLNVIILGIDSVSKLNFVRYFKKSLQFLRQNLSAFELHGYSKVADNTYPNLIPFLTGHQRNYYNGKERSFNFFDDVQFVWKEYADIGYRTLYAEDAPKIGTFVLNRRGFKHPPTDYYTRAFALSVEGSNLRNTNYCIGSKLELEVYFNYLKRFAKTMGKKLFFSFMFMARLTHDVLRQAGYADKPSFELLKELNDIGILNRSLLVFFSDHGIRFGGIRNTYIGKIEERMPFMFLVLPDWFLNKYPVHAANLKINEKRLTTPYDIHATLLHLLQLNNLQFFTNHGQSLLTEISPWRTCSQAMISEHWCVCQIHEAVSNEDSSVKKAALATVQKLNDMLRPYHHSCVKLELHTVLDARISRPSERFISKNREDFADYLITLSVRPSAAVFEATIRSRSGAFTVAEEISRINRYSNQSHCIQDSIARMYCFCKDLENAYI